MFPLDNYFIAKFVHILFVANHQKKKKSTTDGYFFRHASYVTLLDCNFMLKGGGRNAMEVPVERTEEKLVPEMKTFLRKQLYGRKTEL